MRLQPVRRIPFSRARVLNAKLSGLAPIHRIAHPTKLIFTVSLVVLLVVAGTLAGRYGIQSSSKAANAHISSSTTPPASPRSTALSSLPTQHSNTSTAAPVTPPYQEVTTHTRFTAQGSAPTIVHVTVNGHTVPVPKDGTTEQTITDTNGKTTVNISASTTTSSDTNGSSSATTNVQLHTDTKPPDSSMSGP